MGSKSRVTSWMAGSGERPSNMLKSLGSARKKWGDDIEMGRATSMEEVLIISKGGGRGGMTGFTFPIKHLPTWKQKKLLTRFKTMTLEWYFRTGLHELGHPHRQIHQLHRVWGHMCHQWCFLSHTPRTLDSSKNCQAHACRKPLGQAFKNE